MSEVTIYKWIKPHSPIERTNELTAAEVTAIQKENLRLKQEVDILKKAMTIFARYIVLSWQNRCNTDQRTLGGNFYELCDEVNELDCVVVLLQLIELLQHALKQTNSKMKKMIESQLQRWIAG